MSRKTLAAINRTVATGLEGDLSLFATLSTSCGEHFSAGRIAAIATGVFTSRAAISAAGRFVGEALFSIKLLLASSEDEFGATVFTVQRFVLIH